MKTVKVGLKRPFRGFKCNYYIIYDMKTNMKSDITTDSTSDIYIDKGSKVASRRD